MLPLIFKLPDNFLRRVVPSELATNIANGGEFGSKLNRTE
jgi:hypothetical protein